MNEPTPTTPDLQTLVGLFYDAPEELGEFHTVAAADMPPDYRTLLAHEHHMTVTVERFHESLVDVRVLRKVVTKNHYAREILLTRQNDGHVVQYGIMRVTLAFLSPAVRQEIEAAETPLGRILINHGVLRSIHLVSLLSVTPAKVLSDLFNSPPGEPTYGRTAMIYCDNEPAIELLEIVAPV